MHETNDKFEILYDSETGIGATPGDETPLLPSCLESINEEAKDGNFSAAANNLK